MSKYFIDTEFIENGSTIDLISIGIVCSDGREYYAINRECEFHKADDWVLENVLKPMGLCRGGFYCINPSDPGTHPASLYSLSVAQSKQGIKEDLLMFFAPEAILKYEGNKTAIPAEECYKKVECWAYYASYDWVALAQIFGRMMDLPENFPMYCNDIQQEYERLLKIDNTLKLPPQLKNQHNALEDARWCKKAYEFLINVNLV